MPRSQHSSMFLHLSPSVSWAASSQTSCARMKAALAHARKTTPAPICVAVIRLCWLRGTSVRKTRCFLRTDVPRSQHRSSRRFTRSYEHRHLHMMVVPPRGALVALAQQSVRSGRAVVGRATSLQVLCDQLEHTRANLARLGYCHWTWWIIRSAPANTFRADFLLIRVYKSVLHPVGPRART